MSGFFGSGRTLLLAAVAAVALVGCGGDDDNPANNNGNNNGSNNGGGGAFSCGTRECKSAVMPDGKTWMTENLNKTTDSSWCYENSSDSCAKYGRLYTWSAAKAACQSVGMRLPTRDDWDNLAESVGGRKFDNYGTYHDWYDVGTKLKSTSGWNSNGNGTNDFGFSALPGGCRVSGGGFDSAGDGGIWWTAPEGSGGYAYYRYMRYDHDDALEYNGGKCLGFSARCLKD